MRGGVFQQVRRVGEVFLDIRHRHEHPIFQQAVECCRTELREMMRGRRSGEIGTLVDPPDRVQLALAKSAVHRAVRSPADSAEKHASARSFGSNRACERR